MRILLFVLLVLSACLNSPSLQGAELQLKPHDKVLLIGNTFIERMQHANHFETLLHARFPRHELVVRNMGWSADELKLRPRSKDFNDHGHTLEAMKPDVIIACFGFNESFAGPAGLEKYKSDLRSEVKTWSTTKYNGKTSARVLLISPIANENLSARKLSIGKLNNDNLELYTEATRQIAKEMGVGFVDVFRPTLRMMNAAKRPMTFNGVHLTNDGYKRLAPVLMDRIFGKEKSAVKCDLEQLRKEVAEKSLQYWYDYRAVNGYYIYGGRKEPFGVVNFPAEFAKLRKMIANRDRRIWAAAQGQTVPEKIDDSNTGEFAKIETNITFEIKITSPEETLKTFKLPEGYEVNLFASEREFPELENPCKLTFDDKGRLWVCTMSTYPMYLPGEPVHDKLLILEDTDGDGKADKQTIFADGLHLPTGFELGDGGVYVAQQPNLVFLKDTDGDDVADEKEIVLHGFDSADSHHSISAFTWGPGGGLYFQEGTFHHTQVETPYGPQRCVNAGVFRYEPRTEKFEVFVSYPFSNPWGHTFDDWGQDFVADASPGFNYFAAAFSGQVDYPNKHGRMKQFLEKQWRPTASCEFVSSRNFPKETQGDYLLNNCIGFQGTLEYRMKDEGSGFHADPVEPLMQSSDRNYRPIDLQFGPDGALYILDWFNPLVGHMQHSVRDPNRDAKHGRIWRVRYKNNPLVTPVVIDKQTIPELLSLLNTYEQRTRYRVRLALRTRDTGKVIAGVNTWLKSLDPSGSDFAKLQLEALWVHQQHNVIDEKLLKSVLKSKEPRARAAATRVLCYWRDQVKKPLELLEQQVNDEHPRVRLEAVRALSFFKGKDVSAALDVATQSLIYDQDDYLEYTLNETMATLDRRLKELEKQ